MLGRQRPECCCSSVLHWTAQCYSLLPSLQLGTQALFSLFPSYSWAVGLFSSLLAQDTGLFCPSSYPFLLQLGTQLFLPSSSSPATFAAEQLSGWLGYWGQDSLHWLPNQGRTELVHHNFPLQSSFPCSSSTLHLQLCLQASSAIEKSCMYHKWHVIRLA